LPANNDEHYVITIGDALSSHTAALKTGGLDGVHDINLIASAIARPYSGYYPTLAEKAAALTESMATNHGFLEGNKRTTVILTHLLISQSGHELRPLGAEVLQDAMEAMVLDVVEHKMKVDDITAWFRARLHAK
jgi:death on curing protein